VTVTEPARLEARTTFVIPIKPPLWVRVIHKGQTVTPDDPAVLENPHLFQPVTEEVNPCR
jgi:hypothetical protein